MLPTALAWRQMNSSGRSSRPSRRWPARPVRLSATHDLMAGVREPPLWATAMGISDLERGRRWIVDSFSLEKRQLIALEAMSRSVNGIGPGNSPESGRSAV
jgi:hypothetical protein